MDWGWREHVSSVLGSTFDLATSTHNVSWRAPSADEMANEMATSLGPLKTLLGAISKEQGDELLDRLRADFETYRAGDVIDMARPYVLIEGVRRS